MRRLLLIAALLLVAPGPAAAASLSVSVSAPAQVRFGDSFVITVRVQFDRGLVDGRSVRVEAVSAPLTALAPADVRRRDGEVIVTQQVACLEAACVPVGVAGRAVGLSRVRARAQTRDGRDVTVQGARLQVAVETRLSGREARARTPNYTRQTSLPAPHFRVEPNRLAAILLVGGLLLFLGAVAVVVRGARSSPLRRAGKSEPRLERALRLVRESLRRSPDDRRRALDFLAAALEAHPDRRSAAATRLAWSAPEPTSSTVEPLLRDMGQPRGESE